MKEQMASAEEILAELHGGTGSVACLGPAKQIFQKLIFIQRKCAFYHKIVPRKGSDYSAISAEHLVFVSRPGWCLFCRGHCLNGIGTRKG